MSTSRKPIDAASGCARRSTPSCGRCRSRSSAAEAVADDWHARFSCIGRRYLYRIVNRRAPLALEAGRAWRVPVVLDAEAMHEAAQALVGRHDFTTFRSAHCQSESPVKTLDRLDVRRRGRDDRDRGGGALLPPPPGALDGRLPRSWSGAGKWTKADLQAALEARDRAALGLNAPPDGLYFVERDLLTSD